MLSWALGSKECFPASSDTRFPASPPLTLSAAELRGGQPPSWCQGCVLALSVHLHNNGPIFQSEHWPVEGLQAIFGIGMVL